MKITISIAHVRLDNMLATRIQIEDRMKICEQCGEVEKAANIRSVLAELDAGIAGQRELVRVAEMRDELGMAP